LTDIDLAIDNLALRIQPKDNDGGRSPKWHEIKTDLFFDQGQIVMELNDLQYVGSGMITDPESGV